MHWEPTPGRRFAWVMRTPARIIVGIGAVFAVVAGAMPWAEGSAPGHQGFEPVFFSGLAGAGDGLALIIVAAAVGILTIHETPATSRVRTVRLAPAILVVLAMATWVNGYRAAVAEIAAWERRGGSGSPAPGLWLAGLGIGLMAVGTLWLLPQVVRWQRRSDDPADVVTFGWRVAAEAAGGIAGALVGAAAGIAVALGITGPVIIGMIALGAVFGAMAGAYAGSWTVRTLVSRLAGRKRG